MNDGTRNSIPRSVAKSIAGVTFSMLCRNPMATRFSIKNRKPAAKYGNPSMAMCDAGSAGAIKRCTSSWGNIVNATTDNRLPTTPVRHDIASASLTRSLRLSP